MRHLLAACVILVSVTSAHAQTPPDTPSRPLYVGASVHSSTNQRRPDKDSCSFGWSSQIGSFCGSAAGTGLGVTTTVGGFFTRGVGLELAAEFGTSRTGTAYYYHYAGHFASDRTDATYTHREQLFSVLLRIRLPLRNKRTSIEPVVGATYARANDRLKNKVNTFISNDSIPPKQVISYPNDNSTGRTAPGLSTGADMVAAIGRQVSVVGSVRLRCTAWKQLDLPTGWRDVPTVVPVGVGPFSIQLGAGLRWGGR
jgi:hypothetical protein